MRLGELVQELRRVDQVVDLAGSLDTEVTDVVHDSRMVGSGSLFCAVPGAVVDGHSFVGAAVAAGANAVMVERREPGLRVASVQVRRGRDAMPVAAAVTHGHPSAEIDVFGITGTNGKTTTCHLLGSIARAAGRSVEVVGTIGGVHTTPESTDWQRHLRRTTDAGFDLVAAEISSHALDQGRVEATEFAVAAFSNLSPDHLDYHGDMESYFKTKARLFDGRASHELINADDPWGRRLLATRPAATGVAADSLPVVRAGIEGSTIEWRGAALPVPLPGPMNVATGVRAAEAADRLGIDDGDIRTGLAEAPAVPGRMEVVTPTIGGLAPNAPTVVVDYSHTPDAITAALRTLRLTAPAAVIAIVFGCGGDRDAPKRPLMGAAAEAGADIVVVTSDNPRSEDPTVIINQAVRGMREPTRAIVEPDRRAAIAIAIDAVGPSDVVLIAGKGHERTQTIGERVLPFNDAEVAAEVLSEVFS